MKNFVFAQTSQLFAFRASLRLCCFAIRRLQHPAGRHALAFFIHGLCVSSSISQLLFTRHFEHVIRIFVILGQPLLPSCPYEHSIALGNVFSSFCVHDHMICLHLLTPSSACSNMVSSKSVKNGLFKIGSGVSFFPPSWGLLKLRTWRCWLLLL